MDTIFVKSVKPRSSAHTSGLRIGDRLLSVNGDPITGKSYSDVVQLIKFSKDSLVLSVVPRQDDVLQMYFSEIASNPESNQNQVSCTSAKFVSYQRQLLESGGGALRAGPFEESGNAPSLCPLEARFFGE